MKCNTLFGKNKSLTTYICEDRNLAKSTFSIEGVAPTAEKVGGRSYAELSPCTHEHRRHNVIYKPHPFVPPVDIGVISSSIQQIPRAHNNEEFLKTTFSTNKTCICSRSTRRKTNNHARLHASRPPVRHRRRRSHQETFREAARG
jgi:hypothetical protein